MQNSDGKKNFTAKIILIIFQAVVTYQILHFSILDDFLLVYLFTAVLFKWNGGPLFIGGVGMLTLTTLLKKTRPEANISLLEGYQWWIVAAGIMLIVREWIEKKFWNAAYFTRAKIRRVVTLLSKFSVAELRSSAFRAIASERDLLTKSIIEAGKSFGRSIAHIYNLLFGHFSLSIKIKIAILAGIIGMLFFGTNFTLDNILFLLIFVVSILFALDSRFSIGGAGVCLAAALVLFLMKNELWARVMANYAYYFLVIGVTVQMVEYYKGPIPEQKRLSHEQIF